MANKKITELNAASSLAATDVVPVVDVSADETKKITATDLFRTLPDGTAAAPALAFSSDQANGVYLAGTDTVGISTGGTQRITVDGSGNVTISGDLQVNGATTTVQSTTVTIDDKNIELGSVASPSNTTADGGGITLKGATDKTLKWINSTGCWTFNQPMNFNDHVRIDSSGRVGIGTSSPAQPLDIVTSGADAYIRQSNGTVTGFVGVNNNNSAFDIYTFSNHPTRFFTNNTERMRIDSSGNVGIGTSSPTSYGNSQTALVIEDDTNPAICWSDTGQTRDWWAVANGSNLTFNYADGGGSGSASNVTTALSMTNSGNVGIGTTSARRQFHIHDSASATVGMMLTNGNTGESNDSQGFQLKVGSDSHAEISQMENSHIGIFTNASERLRIASNGRVGIGETSPDALLHLKFVSGNPQLILERSSSSTAKYGLHAFSNTFTIKDEAQSQERLRIDGSGNVGIGTASPLALYRSLSIHGPANDQGGVLDLATANQSSRAYVFTDSSGLSVQTATSHPILFKTNNTERLRIDSSGRLYVGTTTAGFANGDDLNIATSGHTGITIRSGTTSTGNIFFADGTSSTDQYRGIIRYDHDADAMPFFTAASERFRITSTGAWAIEGASNYGTSGQVLTSNGNDAPTWQEPAGAGAVGGGTDKWVVETDQTVTTSYELSAGKHGTTVSPTINSGATVTVPSGAILVIL